MTGMIIPYSLFLLFAVYSLVLALVVRIIKMGHVSGLVFGIALLLAYLTRDALSSLPFLPPSTSVLAAFAALVLSNFLIDFKRK